MKIGDEGEEVDFKEVSQERALELLKVRLYSARRLPEKYI